MALIKCEDCGREVSDKAVSCLQCGAPIAEKTEVRATGTRIVTTQATAKKFKGHLVLSAALSAVGAILLMTGNPNSTAFGGVLLLVGLVWFLAARFRAWWHHG